MQNYIKRHAEEFSLSALMLIVGLIGLHNFSTPAINKAEAAAHLQAFSAAASNDMAANYGDLQNTGMDVDTQGQAATDAQGTESVWALQNQGFATGENIQGSQYDPTQQTGGYTE